MNLAARTQAVSEGQEVKMTSKKTKSVEKKAVRKIGN